MPAGITVNGVDLDNILKARTSAKRADVGFKVAGTDISNRYEKTAGGDLIPSNTGFRVGGTDIRTMFQDYNYTPGAPLSCGLDVGAVSGSGTGGGPFTTGNVTATGAGGTPGYTYAWEYVSGDATISCGASTSATTNFSASGTAPATKSAVWRCKVTDSVAGTAYSANVTIDIVFNTASLSVSADKTGVSGLRIGGGSGTATTDAVTVTPTGGTPGYTYLWERISGDASTSANSGTSATTTFSRIGSAYAFHNSTWRCKVTDSAGNIAYSPDVSVTLEFEI